MISTGRRYRTSRARAVLALPAAGLIALLLAGCATPPAATSAEQPNAVAAVALTRTAAKPRSGSSPIDAFDAWYFCRSKVFEFSAGTRPHSDPFKANPYRAKFISYRHGAYRAQIVGKLGDDDTHGAANASYCIVTGTLAHPKITSALYPR